MENYTTHKGACEEHFLAVISLANARQELEMELNKFPLKAHKLWKLKHDECSKMWVLKMYINCFVFYLHVALQLINCDIRPSLWYRSLSV